MNYEFTALIERDPESGWLIGSVTELPGCYTQTPGLAELESNMREAIQVYLETAAEEATSREHPTFVGLQRLEWQPGHRAASAAQDHSRYGVGC